MKIVKNVKSKYQLISQKIGATLASPSERQAQVMLFAFGVVLLSAGLATGAGANQNNNGGNGLVTTYNDERLANSINAILTYIEGSFGAMVMVAAGIGAILSSAFGQYRAALGLLVVAVGAFILRSLVGTFFNDDNIQA